MPTIPLLTAVSSDTVGSGVEVTGDFEAIARGTHYGGGLLELQVSDTNTPADYEPVGSHGIWRGPGSPATIRNNGSKWYRGVLRGVSASMVQSLGSNPSVTLKLVQ